MTDGVAGRVEAGARRPWAVLSAVAGVQAVALLINAGAVAVAAVRGGITGPAEVASTNGVVVEVVVFVLFGAGLGWAAWAARRESAAALTPVLLAQLLVLSVSVPMIASAQTGAQAFGLGATVLAGIGLASWWRALRSRR